MRRKTAKLLDRAKSSLVLAIELFNRPADQGRVEGVLLFFDHAFEMLLKAVILEKTGRISNPREKVNYGFEKSLNICESQLGVIGRDEALIVRNLNGFRDAAAHDVVEISEGLLYSHAQSAVAIFGRLLTKVFKQNLAKSLPSRILPISTSLPSDITSVISADLDGVRGLLGGKRRKEDEAEARLRPYQVIERNARLVEGVDHKVPSLRQLIRQLKSSDWKIVLPMVAGLVQTTPGGLPISLHVTKREGLPVRLDAAAPTAIAFRYVKPEDKWPYLTKELAEKLSISSNKLVGVVKLFGLKGKDEYHTSIKISKAGTVQRYSEKAQSFLRSALEKEGIDKLWEMAKQGKALSLDDYMPSASAASNQGLEKQG